MDEQHRISITICGDGGCGKSSITLRLVRSQWTSEYDPTIEDSYSVTRRIDGQTYHLAITDTAGQEEYRGMWATSNLHSDAFLLVYDITSSSSLDQLSYFNDLIDMETDTRLEAAAHARNASARDNDHQPPPPYVRPIKIVAGNKCDLQAQRQVSAQSGLEWARSHGCGFMETSARNSVNIEETFALLVRRVVEARRVAVAASAAGLGVGKEMGNRKGTQRAATAPLTPLPPEEKMHFPAVGEKPVSKPRSFFRWFVCWR
jgi:GTPase KRas protein